MSDFVRAVRGDAPAAVIRPEFHDAQREVKNAGIRLAILSNELDLFYGADFRDKLPFLKDFDTIHDATYTQVLKPDSRAYQACLAELDLPAEHCVFVDDQMRNIQGAQAVGLQTIHFNVQQPGNSYSAALRLLGL
jgi:putative hydrolase of the HAD superfamily